VREDLGFPPLVTPSSQIVGTQAVLNVLLGERYKSVTRETKNLARGMYGRTARPIQPEILHSVLGDEQPIDHRPADDLPPEMDAAKAEIGELAKDIIDDVLSYVMFPQPAKEFLQWRAEGGGPERELVAAVVGAMTIGERKPQAETVVLSQGVESNGPTNHWRSFGRIRQMR
jgi:oxaloacetate decarboxylase alpha subunit